MNADLLCSTKTEVYGEWIIAKPETKPLWMRLRDSIDVITGKAVAVTFTENISINDIVLKRIQELISTNYTLQKLILDQPENVKRVSETKLTRELQKLSVSFVGNEIKIKKYDILINNQFKLIITDGSKTLDANSQEDMCIFYEDVKLKFIYNKVMDIFWEIEKTIKFMKEDK